MFHQSGLYKKKSTSRKTSMTEKEMMRLSHLPMIPIGGRPVSNPYYVDPIESDSDSDSGSEDEDKPEITEKPLRFTQTSKLYQRTGKRPPYSMLQGTPESTDSFLPVVVPAKASELDSDDDTSSLSSLSVNVSYQTVPEGKKVTRFAHTVLEKRFEEDAAFYDDDDCGSCNSSRLSFSSLIGSQYSFASGRSTKRAWLKKAWKKVY
ncbi:hypothetical protein Moror_3920 [Moniliophthora roreri MCA 2997]|uniref:Uncharacterized protein n=2 Tax=Moniliophthora roreri TaxID=221103 RepID=V2XR36_MONRO|nr:hypothetical protein Moror_3920 [Moniliophthora roreri MCA 2997]KAI3601011.1 hypothetical protein WG66_014844 [Moniliophthora roreri]